MLTETTPNVKKTLQTVTCTTSSDGNEPDIYGMENRQHFFSRGLAL